MGGSNFTGGRKRGQFSVFSAEISFVRHGMKEGCAGVGALRGSRNCAHVVNSVRWARWDFRAGSRIPGRRCARFPWDWDLHRVRGNRGGTMVMVMVGAEGAGWYRYNRLGAGWQKLAGFRRAQKIPSILSSDAYLQIRDKKCRFSRNTKITTKMVVFT